MRSLLLLPLATWLLLLPAVISEDWNDFMQKHLDVDLSAVKLCWINNGQIQLMDSSAPDKGHKCEYEIQLWTADNKHALEYCESRNPYPIIHASVSEQGGLPMTKCIFQITLECEPDWHQINGKCYKVMMRSFKKSYHDANAYCKQQKPSGLSPRLADYYSNSLSVDFANLQLSDVWVSVPNLPDYFEDFSSMTVSRKDQEAAVFVLDGAFKYDTKPGSIVLADATEEHQVMCEYTPPMTLAEMYRLAKRYNEIYPFETAGIQVTFATSSYMTLTQTEFVKNARTGKDTEKFTSEPIKEMCMKIGKILHVKSYPLSSFRKEYDLVRNTLKNHRFFITAAMKNDGCSRMNIFDNGAPTFADSNVPTGEKGYCEAHSLTLNKQGRYPSMAAMRAPAICSLRELAYEYASCGAGWIQFDRDGGKRICHFLVNEEKFDFESAKTFCADKGAALGGFESLPEFEAVRRSGAQGYTHYLLGGVLPCVTDCRTQDVASWEEGVSRNTVFLNDHDHDGHEWGNKGDDVISYRADLAAFHTHNNEFTKWALCCSRYAGLVEKKTAAISITG